MEREDEIRIDGDDQPTDVIEKVNRVLAERGLTLKDVSEDGADFCAFKLVEVGM